MLLSALGAAAKAIGPETFLKLLPIKVGLALTLARTSSSC